MSGDVHQRRGQVHDPFLVGVPDDQRAVAVEHLAQRADLADDVVVAGLDDGQRLVQPHLLAALQGSTSTVGDTARRIRRPPVNTSTEPSGPGGQENPVAAGRLGEPVDLFLELQQLGARITQGDDELLVPFGQRVDPVRGFGELAFQRPGVARDDRQPATELRHLVVEHADLSAQLRRGLSVTIFRA